MMPPSRDLAAGTTRRRLARYRELLPPVERREFWLVQALVVSIAAGHTLLEIYARRVEPQALYLIPTSFFFVPVVYAALNFGLRGSLPTALWSTVLTLPNVFLFHQGPERLGVLWQATILVSLAIFVGQRVDRERAAHGKVARREEELRISEQRYRSLFDTAAEAVLVIAADRTVEELNAAAARLLRRELDDCRGRSLEDLVGSDLAADIGAGGTPTPRPLHDGDGTTAWVEAVNCGSLRSDDGSIRVQAMLRDVTLELERRAGLEGYARAMLTARDDEQRRIARELHDGPLQTMIVLWRGLNEAGTESGPGIARLRDVASDTTEELRRITQALRSPVLDNLGLLPALRSATDAFAARTGIDATCTSSGSVVRLPPETEFALFRIAQEALHNVERHAHAETVQIHLSFRARRISLRIADDGVGLVADMSEPDLLRAGRFGVVGMRERAVLVRGQFRMRNRPGGGSVAEVTLPVATALVPGARA